MVRLEQVSARDISIRDVTFNQTEILQISVDEIKTREFIETSPYKGLKKFELEDTDYFFGRDQFLKELVNELKYTNLVLVLGASGSGKSSVVRAGLIPQLRKKKGFVNLTFAPDQDPFESLYASLLRNQYPQEEAKIARDAKVDTLTQVIKKLKQYESYWFIFIDQFEELFTTTHKEKCDLFVASLVQLVKEQEKAKDRSVQIMATMRADFLDRLDRYPKLVKATDKHRPLIAQMQTDELRLAIERPAAHHGVVFEEGLVEEIIKDVQGQAGYLPLLQYTLNLLWDTEVQNGSIHDRTLNKSTYRTLGGVRGALQTHVGQIYRDLPESKQSAAKKIFLKLVGIGGDEESGTEWKPVRRRALRSEFSNKLEQDVLVELINKNLLVSDHLSQFQESTVEIAHEVLLTSWTTLSDWIKHNRQAIALRNRLNEDVARWQEKKLDNELWTGSKLERVLELRKDPTFNQVLSGFSETANQFIDASVGLRDRQERRELETAREKAQEAEARRKAEEEARKQAEERAKQEKKARKAAQTTTRVTVGAAVVVLGFTIFAGYQWRNAQENTINALAETSEASLLSNRQLEALVAAVQSGKQLQNPILFPDSALSQTVNAAVQRAVYNVQERNRLEGHSKAVRSVVFSRDGKTLASGSFDKSIKLWDVATHKQITTLTGHSNAIWSVVFSPDGKTLASGSDDKSIKLWNVATGKQITTLTGHSDSVYSVAFSPNGKTLASGSDDNNIKLWDVATGKQITTLTGHSNAIWSVVFSPDGKTLASGSRDNSIKLWNVATGKQIITLTGHSKAVRSVVFSRDGKTLASGSRDNSIKLWDVATGKQITTLTGHSDSVSSVAFSPDGKTLASGSEDGSIKLWDVATGKQITTLTGDSNQVSSVAFSPDGKTLASGSFDSIKLWDVATGKQITTLTGHSNAVYSVVFSRDGKTLASGSFDKSIKLWNVATGKQITTLTGDSNQVSSVAFSPDGKTLASGSFDNNIKLWDVATSKPITTLTGHSDSVSSVAFSPDGKTLASGSFDNSIKLWKIYPNNLNDLMSLSCNGLYEYLHNPTVSDRQLDHSLCDGIATQK